MKRLTSQFFLRVYIFLFLPLYFFGCATFGPTQPSLPYAGNSYPTVLNDLAKINPLFVQELGKLPELQDGVSKTEMSALNDIVELYKSNPANFETAFNEMLKVGLPEFRKYCSPLQALFWLVEDGNINTFRAQLDDYSLENLLWDSWDFYRFDRNIERWSDFKNVTDRLNAPELLNFFINDNIYYKKNRTNSHTPKHTFIKRWGDCDDLAVFGKYILNRGGYSAKIRYVHWTTDDRGHVGVVIKIENGRYFIAVDFDGRNIMSGPYTKLSDVDKKLSLGHDFHDSGWWR